MTASPGVSILERSVLGSRPVTAASEIDVLVEEIAELRPLPPIAAQVLQIAEGDHFSAHELAQAISSDPALTARVLRVANSAYYGFPRRITTIRDAVVLLGFRQVRSTLFATTAMRTLPAYEGIEAFAFWRHSVAVGVLAGLLARAEGTHQEEAFTAGVLHNVGRLALEQARPAEFRRARAMAADESIPLHEAEQRLFGFTDAELGGRLALRWGFPPALASAIAEHGASPATFEDLASLPALVARARAFAASHGISDGAEPPSCPSRRAAMSTFSASMAVMSPDDLPRPAMPCGSAAVEDALEVLVAEQGGLGVVLDRAAAFVEHTASGA